MVEQIFMANAIEIISSDTRDDVFTNFLHGRCCNAASDAHLLNGFSRLNVSAFMRLRRGLANILWAGNR